MRPGYYQETDGTIVNGHWHHMLIKVGDFYQSRKTDKWFVVESVTHMSGPDDNNWFCQIREATPEELEARTKPNVIAEKKLFSDFFDGIDN